MDQYMTKKEVQSLINQKATEPILRVLQSKIHTLQQKLFTNTSTHLLKQLLQENSQLKIENSKLSLQIQNLQSQIRNQNDQKVVTLKAQIKSLQHTCRSHQELIKKFIPTNEIGSLTQQKKIELIEDQLQSFDSQTIIVNPGSREISFEQMLRKKCPALLNKQIYSSGDCQQRYPVPLLRMQSLQCSPRSLTERTDGYQQYRNRLFRNLRNND